MKLTSVQARRLIKGRGVQLKPEQVGLDGLPQDTPVRIIKALEKALRKGTGMRMKLNPNELVEGSGFLDFLKSLGRAVMVPFRALAPALKPVAKALAPVVAPIIASKTGIPVSGDILSKGVDIVGDIAGVGMKKGGRGFKAAGHGVDRGKGRRHSVLADNSSQMIAPIHPVFGSQPQFTGHDLSKLTRPRVVSGSGIVINPKQFQNVYTSKVIPDMTSGNGFRSSGY